MSCINLAKDSRVVSMTFKFFFSEDSTYRQSKIPCSFRTRVNGKLAEWFIAPVCFDRLT